MAPSAISPDTTSELIVSGMQHTLNNTTPSFQTNGVSTIAELDAAKLIFTRNLNPQTVPSPNSPEIWDQNQCTDHMVTCQWTASTGWSAPHLRPYGPLSLMPTASVLHYATECFEGMKSYRGYDSKLRVFRPSLNCHRMLNSALRISLPAFDPAELEKLIKKLVSVDGEKWLPKSRPGTFLYLRPTMIATAPSLGVQKPKEALLYIIACIFPAFDESGGTVLPTTSLNSQKPLRRPGLHLLASKEDTIRAWPGGFGYAKVGANYGPSLIAQAEARERGYDQVLWLLGSECLVTEAGASNFFVVWRTQEGRLQLVTAPLDDKVILDGVTRRSVLELVRERLSTGWDGVEALEIVERRYTMREVELASEEGRLVEAFAAGTAFFISAVGEIRFRGRDLEVPLREGTGGTYAMILKGWLRDVMYGRVESKWGVVVEETGVGK